jgi:hypothetical protein
MTSYENAFVLAGQALHRLQPVAAPAALRGA